MFWYTIQKIDPILKKIYRKLSQPPVPNLKGDRDIEYSWVAANMPEGPGMALDFGCGSSYLGLIAAQRGFKVAAIDLASVNWAYVHPNLTFLQKDIFDLNFLPSSLDLIINCSAIEHVGLGRYGDHQNSNGDIEAMNLLNSLLKSGGIMLLTIPVGKDRIFLPLHRVYGSDRLPLLLDGFLVEKKEYWVKDHKNYWVRVDEKVALNSQPKPPCYGIGCFVLSRP